MLLTTMSTVVIINAAATEANHKLSKTNTKTAYKTQVKAKIDKTTNNTSLSTTKKQPPESGSFTINLSQDEKGNNIWQFPWQKNVAAAAFYRAGFLWVIFNDNQKVNFTNLQQFYGKAISEISQASNREYTILRFRSSQLSNFRMYKQGFSWMLAFQDVEDGPVLSPEKSITQYKTPYSKGIFFPADNMASTPLIVTDPFVGDQLAILTIYDGETGVSPSRKFIDFTLLASAQGFVINPLSDQVRLTVIVPGIEILVPRTESSFNELQEENAQDKKYIAEHVYSTLPFDKWKDLTTKEFAPTYHHLLKNIIEAKTVKAKNTAKLEMARFYLGIGYAQEAHGLLRYMANLDPDFCNDNKILFLKATAEFLMTHYKDASVTLNKINTQALTEEDRLEVLFWRNATDMLLGKTVAGYDFLRFKDRFLKTYLPKLFYQFAFLDVEDSLNRQDLVRADDVLRFLTKSTNANAPKTIANDLTYYTGQYLLSKGDNAGALNSWKDLTDNLSDNKNRARASFATTKALFELQKISLEEAIARLNNIRFAWRGDKQEYKLLSYLGELYLQNKDYTNTLRTWKELTADFADQTDLLEMTARMSKLFAQLFGIGGVAANNISDLQTIALFYEFRELIPIGKMGDEIVQQLAFKLAKLDLLDRASNLLAHQVNFRLTGLERPRTANKLAMIYLLDHKPTNALSILDATEDNAMPRDLKTERLHIRAQALADLNQSSLALTLLQGDNSLNAFYIQTSIYWDKQDWQSVIQTLEPAILMHNTSKQLSQEDQENILRLAICYFILKNDIALQSLYNKFIDLMPVGSNHRRTFDFIAAGDVPLDHRDLESSLGVPRIQTFMQNFRKSLAAPTSKS